MSAKITIKAENRQETGKGSARRLRAKGWIPANLIGDSRTSSTMLSLEAKDLSKRFWNKGIANRTRLYQF